MARQQSAADESADDPLDRLVVALAGKAMRLAERIDAEIERVSLDIGDDVWLQS